MRSFLGFASKSMGNSPKSRSPACRNGWALRSLVPKSAFHILNRAARASIPSNVQGAKLPGFSDAERLSYLVLLSPGEFILGRGTTPMLLTTQPVTKRLTR